ncbi:4-galactosyl-N-acetylglucosaminide 3-alpha-L-fucosyltransferase 9-like [Cheilinus undulatus]|uniref:4-galactosyl-N-acetylglucosaminide 3-alpha-L-fucosyltransferase 9-like n=1 Tax=Cheilinus undulatus TaxID=241271 RepID=UPI001BD1FA59|nr:4-galactosyl-N-acetylglucosaminide 3-alpha-L-fucosyltransferase 9-like [Cheilinus undulatus]
MPSRKCPPPMARSGIWGQTVRFPSIEEIKKASVSKPKAPMEDKPLLLLWSWPENKKFDLQDCDTLFGIDGCRLTDNRSLFSSAHGVLFFHRGISDDLSNVPTLPRPKFQRWIWFNPDPPSSTRTIEGIRGLFNLTMSYRKDADIQARWQVSFKTNTDAEFILPKKEHLLCWIVDAEVLHTKSRENYRYYRDLLKHINVDIFFSTEFAKSEDYFLTISSCKFYLSLENSVEPDHITETLNGPLAAGTVPIVLGPPRNNYEDFIPGSSFIHVNDFSGPDKLAKYLVELDKDYSAYIRYFEWRKYYIARPHFIEDNYEFTHSICQACYHLSINKVYRVVPDLYKWFFG